MIIQQIFQDSNPETNTELKNLYATMIFVEKLKTNIWTEYTFADTVENKTSYLKQLKEDELLQEVMQDKYWFANECFIW